MKRINYMAVIISCLILAWLVLSYVNVMQHNMQIGYSYPVWNVFTYIK